MSRTKVLAPHVVAKACCNATQRVVQGSMIDVFGVDCDGKLMGAEGREKCPSVSILLTAAY